MPEIATRLTPLVPYPLERKLGEAVDAKVRATLDTGRLGAAFECGSRDGETAGRAAFDKLTSKLEAAAGLPSPLKATVVRRSEVNAVALPGGRIYVYQGLIDKAETADELAGIIAHEIGHVANRDGTRSILQAAGLSLLFGMLLGDFVGGGAVVLAATTILKQSYSRDVETAADLHAVLLMTKVGGDARALGSILLRLGGSQPPGNEDPARSPRTQGAGCRGQCSGGIDTDPAAACWRGVGGAQTHLLGTVRLPDGAPLCAFGADLGARHLGAADGGVRF